MERFGSAARRSFGRRNPVPPRTVVPSDDGYNRAGAVVYCYGAASFTDTAKYPYTAALINSSTLTANKTAWDNYWAGRSPKGRSLVYRTVTETASALGVLTYPSVAEHAAVTESQRFYGSGAVIPAEEVKYHDSHNLADQWMLFSSAGNPLYYSGYSQSWLVDPGSATMRAQALVYLRDLLDTLNYDGVFFDNILYTSLAIGPPPYYRKNSSNQLVVAYSTYAEYATAVETLMDDIGDTLKSEGYYVAANCHMFIGGDGTSDSGVGVQSWWNRIAPHCDMVVSEYGVLTNPSQGTYVRRSTDNAAYYDWLDGWTTNLHPVARSHNTDATIGVGDSQSESDLRYAVALQRTVWDFDAANNYFVSFFGSSNYWPATVLSIDWGEPVGGLLTSGTIRARRWSGAWAAVNTSRTAASATFTDPLTSQSRTFNLAGVTGYVGQ